MLFEGFSVVSNTIDIKGSWDWAISALVLMLALALIVRGGVRHVNRAAPIFLSVVILSIILLLLGIFLFAGGAYKGALSWSDRDFGDNVKPDFERTDVRCGVPRRLHAIFVNRLWETRSWMVYFSSLSRFVRESTRHELPRRTPHNRNRTSSP